MKTMGCYNFIITFFDFLRENYLRKERLDCYVIMNVFVL